MADLACEEALYDSVSLRRFVGIDWGREPVPGANILPQFRRLLGDNKLSEAPFATHYARDHAVDDALKQMVRVQGAIWSNAHVCEAVAAMKGKRAGSFTALSELQSFREIGL